MSDARAEPRPSPIPIGAARFDLEIERLRTLRKEQPPQRGVDPMMTSPDLVHAIARAADIWSVKKIAEALAMGKSTVHEWIARADRDADGARLCIVPDPWREDIEVSAICRCLVALDAIDREARHRVLNYLDERYAGKSKVRP